MPTLDKKEEAAINPKNKDNKCFQTVALNCGETESHPERVSNIKPFIIKWNWKGINYQSNRADLKTFERNNLTTTLNILYIKEKEIYAAYI